MEIIRTFWIRQNKYTVQYRSLHLMLICGIILGYSGTILRIILGGGLTAVMLSLISGVLCTLLFYYAWNDSNPYLVKLLFIIYMDFIYFPLSWITTSGSLSFMPYYSILFLLATFILIERQYEYILPAVYMLTAVFLMYAEVRWPNLVHHYETSTANALHLGFHYTIVTIMIGLVFTSVFSHYLNIQSGNKRYYTNDELTGLFSRSHGLHLLQQTFDDSKINGKEYSLLLLSLTGLRSINETYGSNEGDTLIAIFAKLLKENTRTDDLCCRYSGNLFLVLLNQSDPIKTDGFIHRLKTAFDNETQRYSDIAPKFLVGKAGFDYNDIGSVLATAETELDSAKKDFFGGQHV